MLWSRTYGGAGNEELWSVIVTSDGGFAAAGWTTSFGAGAGDFWLIKTDASGNVEWNKTYGGKNFEAATCLKQTKDGGFVLVGYTYSYGAGGSDIWLIKTDKYGNAQWNITYGGSNEDYGFCVTQTTDGGYAIAGSTSSFGAGVYDFWLIKTNGLGQPVWNKTYGGPGYDEAWCITQVSEDSLVIAGWTESFGSGGSDCWFIAVDLQGQILWHQTWGGEKNDYAYSLACELDGVFLLCGQTQSLGVGGSDFLLLKVWEVSNKLSFGGSRMPLLK
jgi:predicted secreted protein